ncbi:MAG: CheR family methyltransferase [Candidatus Obscuribacterales bacterium]
MKASQDDPKLEELLLYIKRSRAVDFTGYKRTSILRRISKRLAEVGIDDFLEYIDYLEVHPGEFTELLNTMLINVTSFFRDPEAWKHLEDEIIPKILAQKSDSEPLRIWSAGCASGQEPLSLLMLFAEYFGGDHRRLKIYATDIDEDALAEARAAAYSSKDLEAVPVRLAEKYFTRQGSRYTFKADLRRAVIFGRHDIVLDAPISKLDLLVCRNTLMYMNSDTQRTILSRFHFALNDTGFLMTGKAELMLAQSDLFQQVDLKHRVFKKATLAHQREFLRNVSTGNSPEEVLSKVLQLREAAFDSSPTAELVIDRSGALLLANKSAMSLFRIDESRLGSPFQDLELSYRPLELRSIIQRCYDARKVEIIESVEYSGSDGQVTHLSVSVVPLSFHGNLIGASISFLDVSASVRINEALLVSKQALESANEELQSTQEELETTNEELQSTNEELETTNEELQSTNEELETMNEELQSTNQELETINQELREMSRSTTMINSLMKSILASIDFAVFAVDSDFKILMWNEKAFELWGLRAEEVLSKSFLDLDIGLPVEFLRKPILSVRPDKHDELTIDATNRRGRPISCRIQISRLEPGGAVIMINETSKGE